MTMARSLIAQQTPVLVIAPRRSPLRSLEGTPGVLAVLGSELDVEYLRATLNPLDRYVVLVDDAEMLYNAPNSEILERIIVSGRDADHGLILAGTTADLSSCYSGFIATARKSRCGVLVAVDTPTTATCSASGCRATPGRARSAAACCSARAAPLRSARGRRGCRSEGLIARLIAWRESPVLARCPSDWPVCQCDGGPARCGWRVASLHRRGLGNRGQRQRRVPARHGHPRPDRRHRAAGSRHGHRALPVPWPAGRRPYRHPDHQGGKALRHRDRDDVRGYPPAAGRARNARRSVASRRTRAHRGRAPRTAFTRALRPRAAGRYVPAPVHGPG